MKRRRAILASRDDCLRSRLATVACRIGVGHQAGDDKRLPVIGPAPAFALTSQDGKPVTLADLRGKVVAVTFIYTGVP